MTTNDYLDVLLARYAGSFDIEKDVTLYGKTYAAFCSFSSMGEKYVLSKKARLWAYRTYEYMLLVETETCTEELLQELRRVMVEYLEPVYVRKNNKYPEEDHMVSYLTAVVLCEKRPTEEVLRQIKRFKYDKGYLFSLRGHAEAHLVVADMETEGVYHNSPGRLKKKIFRENFTHVKNGSKGYNELYSGV